MPLAFKGVSRECRFKYGLFAIDDRGPNFESAPDSKSTNIVNLEGICWEIQPRMEKADPVLVYEKAAWDLQQFMSTTEGMNMTIDDRLKIYANIGNAIMVLHAYGLSLEVDFDF
jgi:hypothetical protein